MEGNVQSETESANGHFAMPAVIISLVSNHPWVPKPLDEWLLESKKLAWSHRIPPQITYREKNVPSQQRALVPTTSSKWHSLSPTKLEKLTL